MCRGKPNAEVVLPQLIRAVQPEMKVVVMLRDPVARMYSAFWYYGCLYNVYKEYGMSPKGFHRLATVRSRAPQRGCHDLKSCTRGHVAVPAGGH